MIYRSLMAKTIKQLRNELGAYLSKPLIVSTGSMSTQQNVNATSLSTGGLEGQFLIKQNGEIVVDDGTNERVLIGKI